MARKQGGSAGSQLSQLKSSLKTAGLFNLGGTTKKKGKKGKAASGADAGRRDVDARRKKLEEIAAGQNLFDTKSTRSKFPVGGQSRPSTSTSSQPRHKPSASSLRVTGRPSQSRSRADQIRREELLPEYLSRHRNSSFLDRRFASGPADDAALERFTRERQERFERDRRGVEEPAGGLGGRKGKRKVFNLEDDDEGLFDDEGLGGGGLTHAGRALDLGSDDDDDGPDGSGDFQLRRRDASPPPDSAPEDEGEDETGRPKKKKSKAEVMSELISKSKYHKYQRQKGKEEDDEERLGLDEELKAIRGLLVGGGAPAANGSKRKREQDVEETQPDADSESQDDGSDDDDNAGAQVDGEETSKVDRALLARLIGSPSPDPPPASPAADKDEKATESGDDDYDRFVRELAFEARAKPSDRMLTATEKAMEEAERLRGLEERRRRRMLGLQEEEDGEGVRQQGGKKGKARGEADDLEGDFVASEDEAFGVGQGLRPDGAFGGGLALDGDDDDEDDGSEGDSDEEDEEADIDLEDFEGDDLEDPDSAQGPSQPLVAPSKPSKRSKSARASTFELAYTYPCPSSHSEFLSTLASASAKPSHVPTVIERIRTLYHPSLAEDNHSKLAVLGGVVLDHIIYLSSRTDEDGAFEAINAIAEHLVALTQAYPQQLASHFVSKLSLMQRNLIRGLIDQASAPSADAVKVKVFPGLTELTVLRLVGAIWSTSDFSHPVAAPALLLVGQYLAQARVKTLSDLASGTFLCSLVLQYESISKRLVPEAVNFLANSLLLLLPGGHVPTLASAFPHQEILGTSSAADFAVPAATQAVPGPLSLRSLLSTVDAKKAVQEKVDLLDATLSLVSNFAALYGSLDAFIEIFAPFEAILATTTVDSLPKSLFARFQTTSESLLRQLKFARESRRPLRMQHHRAIPIPSLAPAFDDGDPTKRRWDPDTERAEASKLKALLKKEKKGAVRELRKDNRFLAAQKAREKAEEDKAYNTKIARITAGLQEERAEEKKAERTKMRIKRQDKARRGGGRR